MKYNPSGLFVRVYQGGHHDVYCNGTAHVWLSGDQFGVAKINPTATSARIRTGKCDCERWKHGQTIK